MINISIVIINYNTKELLSNCIESIIAKTVNIEYEIIVVDNDSTDGSCEYIRERYKDVVLVRSKKNLGFGRANNIGVKFARGMYLFFLNSDTILLDNTVRQLYDFFENSGEIKLGVIGVPLVDQKLNLTHSYGNIPTPLYEIFALLNSYLYNIFRINFNKEKLNFKKNNFIRVGYITGADMFLQKWLFEEIGGFDPSFFMYYEESDLQKRINLKGFSNFIVNATPIVHLEGKSFNTERKVSLKKLLLSEESKYIYMKKNNKIFYICFRLIYSIFSIPLIFDTRLSVNDRLRFLYTRFVKFY